MPPFPRALIALGLSLVATAAEAQVAWEVPDGAGCPTEAEVRARAESLLAGSMAVTQPTPMRAHVRALGDGTFELSLATDAGARELRGESCDVVADAAALIYAMTIDPDVVARLAAAEEPTLETARAGRASLAEVLEVPAPAGPSAMRNARGPLIASVVSAAPVARDDARRADEQREAAVDAERSGEQPPLATEAELDDGPGPTWALGAGATGDAGLLPSISIGPTAHAGVELGALRIDARAMFSPSREAHLENHATARGDVSFVGGEARGCAVALRAAVELAPCAGITAGAMQAEGRGVSSPGSSAAPFFAVSAGGTAALPIAEWLALRADLSAVVPITRPAFVIDGVDGVVHRPSAVGARLALSAEVRLR